MHSPAPLKVTTAQVFAIAGPAMVANLTTPLIGIVSTTAIGRLGDAALLGGVAMASVLFDCMFWLFGFLRMSTVAFTAQSLGAGETRGIARDPGARADRRGADRRCADRPADPARRHPARRDGRQRGRHARCQNLLHHPDLVCAAGARQLCRARLADRAGPRQTGARRRRSSINLINAAATVAAGAGVRRSALPALPSPRVIAEAAGLLLGLLIARRSRQGQSAASPRAAVRPRKADAHARGQPRHHDPHRVADRGVAVLHRAGRARRRRDARRQCRTQQFSAVRRLLPRRPRQRRRAALRPRLWRARQSGLRRRGASSS